MFDLCLHLGCSLKNACKAFKIEEQWCKTTLDHREVQALYDSNPETFYQTLLENEEFQKYVENDVISLYLIYNKYNQNMYNCVKQLNETVFINNKVPQVEICEVMTKGALAYKMTECGFKENNITFKPLDIDTYNDVRASRVGGRCEMFNSVIELIMKILSLDVTSLYPYIMAIMNVYYPYGTCSKIMLHR